MKKILMVILVLISSMQVFAQEQTPEELKTLQIKDGYTINVFDVSPDLKGNMFKVMVFYNGIKMKYRLFLLIKKTKTSSPQKYLIINIDKISNNGDIIDYDPDVENFIIKFFFENKETAIISYTYNHSSSKISWAYREYTDLTFNKRTDEFYSGYTYFN